MSNQNIGSLGQSSILEVDSSPNLREYSPSNASIDDSNPLFERVCEVFMKAKEERQESDIQVVVEAIKTIKFFQDLRREDVDFDDFLVTIYEVLNHEHFHKQEAVFHFGERGTKFYVIIKGTVDVYVPKSREEIDKSLVEKKESGHWKRRLSRFRDSASQEPASEKNGTISRRESMREGSPERRGKDAMSSQFSTDVQKLPVTKRQSRSKARENARELEMFTGLDEKGMYVEEGILRFKKVRSLNVGDTFGELALSSDMARSATVIASKDLQVLTLSKMAYKKIFEYLERNLKQKWRFFSEITENSSQETMLGFCYGFKEKSFRYGQTLFHQGQFPQNIFIIRDGEIQIVKYEEQGNNGASDKLNHLRKKKKTLVEKRIVNLGPYNLVGEGAALLDQKYDYTARSVSNETVAYVLPIQEFEKLRLKYADIWKKVLKKHETKNEYWERRESNITQTQDKIEEDRQSRIRSNSFKNAATARDESFDSIAVNKTEDDDRESLLSRRGKNGYKLPLKIFPQQKASDSGERPQKMSPYSSERLSSFCYEDQSEVELTQRENPEPVSARLVGPTASFNGAKVIPGIVESKFKVMQKQSLQAKDPKSAEGMLNLTKQPSTSTPKKLFDNKSGALSERKIAASAAIKKDQSVSFSQTHRHFLPYKLESLKGKVIGMNMNSLQLEGISHGSKQEIDIPTLPTQRGQKTMIINTSRSIASHKKSLKLGDSPPLKNFGDIAFQFKTEEQEIKSNRQQGSVYLPNLQQQQVTSASIMASSRGYKSARTFQTTAKSQFIKNSDYLISESDADLLTIELGGPHKSKKEQSASLCMNTFKTVDQVPQLSNIFKKIGNIVAPVENLKELQKIPTSYLGKMSQKNTKSKTIFPSHHNMFRMKPNKLHLLTNSYKFDMMSPSGIRAKR